MKRVQAVIRPDRFDQLQHALVGSGFSGFTVTDVRAHGQNEASPSGEWRGVPYAMSVKHKLLVDILVGDDEVASLTKVIKDATSTGAPGDGLIFVLDLAVVIPIGAADKAD
jgi:nitrogen regulatory protein P-II 1